MSRVNIEEQSAVILHQYNYRNSSLIVHFFTREFGKLSAIAKGVKGVNRALNESRSKSNSSKSKKNQMFLFQPFRNLVVSLTGKNDLLTLKNIEINTDKLQSDWKLKGKSLYCAYYVNELLLRLLPSHTDCQEIFNLYQHVLNALAECSARDDLNNQYAVLLYEAPLRYFELNLLELLGYGLNLCDEISSGNTIEKDQDYFYIMNYGPSLVEVSNTARIRISGATLLNLVDKQFNDKKTLQESKVLLKWALNEHLGNKPLKSRELFKQLYCDV